VSYEEEWNAAILGATAESNDNYYSFAVDIACYGVDHNVEVRVEVQEANAMDSTDTGTTMVFSETVFCQADETMRVIFINESQYKEDANQPENEVYYLIDTQDRVYSYQSVHISLNESDSFMEDNSFDIYGGQREVIKVQYASAAPNTFYPSVLYALKEYYGNKVNRWDIQITEVKSGEDAAVEGYDFYLFEHQMPQIMPKDGVVFLANPDPEFGSVPTAAGVQVKGYQTFAQDVYLMAEAETHPMLKHVNIGNVTVQRFVSASYDPAYEVLASCANEPVLMVRNDEEAKVVVMGFSVHYSNLTLESAFVSLLYNTFEYFFPVTVEGNAFEVYEEVTVNTRGSEVYVSRGSEVLNTFQEFPSVLKVNLPGTYVLTQTTYFGKNVSESIYVKIPEEESNIFKKMEDIPNPYVEQDEEDYFKDLLLYIAAAMVAIQFLEWWLQSHYNM
jgi:hypothetical protein